MKAGARPCNRMQRGRSHRGMCTSTCTRTCLHTHTHTHTLTHMHTPARTHAHACAHMPVQICIWRLQHKINCGSKLHSTRIQGSDTAYRRIHTRIRTAYQYGLCGLPGEERGAGRSILCKQARTPALARALTTPLSCVYSEVNVQKKQPARGKRSGRMN